MNPATIQSFRDFALDVIPSDLAQLVGAESVERSIDASIRRCLERMTDLVAAEAFQTACPVDGLQLEDYLYRVICFDDERAALISLRFCGGAVHAPFIEVEHANFLVLEYLDEFFTAARGLYPVLTINRLRTVLAPADATGLEEDQGYYIGSIRHAVHLPAPINYDRVQLLRPNDLSRYLMFNEAYESLPEEIKSIVWIESEETLMECLKNGMLFEVFIDGEWAGVVAARRDRGPYWDGVCVAEEVLSEGHRGRGFGRATQRRLLEELRAMGEKIIWGTISPQNNPSIAVAKGNGREKLCAMYWVDSVD